MRWLGGVLLKLGVAKELLIAGGPTAGEENLSEAQAMKELLVRWFKIDPQVITTEDESLSTHQNAINIKDRIGDMERGLGTTQSQSEFQVGVLTVAYHLPRAAQTLDNHGISGVVPFAAEAVLANWRNFVHTKDDKSLDEGASSRPYQSLSDRMYRSPRVAVFEAIRERLSSFLLAVDPDGNIMNALVKRFRGGDGSKLRIN